MTERRLYWSQRCVIAVLGMDWQRFGAVAVAARVHRPTVDRALEVLSDYGYAEVDWLDHRARLTDAGIIAAAKQTPHDADLRHA